MEMLEEFFRRTGTRATMMDRRETREAWRRWSQAFAAGRGGGLDGGPWNNLLPSRGRLLGDPARGAFETFAVERFLLLFFREHPSYRCEARRRPDYDAFRDLLYLLVDAVYLVDPDFEWTLVCHHEQVLGDGPGPILACSRTLRDRPPWLGWEERRIKPDPVDSEEAFDPTRFRAENRPYRP